MASAGRVRLAYVKETTAGTTPGSAVLKSIPFNTGGRFANARDLLTSAQVQSTRKTRSSRLGTNNPEVTVSSELQWDTYDELLAGGFGSAWTAGFTKTVSVTVDTGGILTRGSGSWITDGFLDGQYCLYVDNGTTRVLEIDSVDTGTLELVVIGGAAATTTAVTGATSKVLITGEAGGSIDCSGDTVTFNGTARTMVSTTYNFITTGKFQAGDNIYIDGSSGSEGWHKISTISADGKTVTFSGTSTVTNQSKTTGTLSFMSDTGSISNGNTLGSFSFEEAQLDITKMYRGITGCKVSQLGFTIQPNAMIGLNMTLMGMGITEWTASSIGSSTTDYTAREQFDSFTGSMLIEDTATCITGCDVTLNNATGRNFCLFTRNASGITDGIPDITGTTTMYFSDPDKSSNLYFDETLQDYRIRMIDPSGNAYVLDLAGVRYTGDTITIGDIDVTESLPFRCEPQTAPAVEMKLRRQAAAR